MKLLIVGRIPSVSQKAKAIWFVGLQVLPLSGQNKTDGHSEDKFFEGEGREDGMR